MPKEVLTKTKVNIAQDPAKPIEKNILAKAIVDISTAMRRLLLSGLNRDAVVVLVQDMTKLPKRDIDLVMRSIDDLERRFCR